MGAPEVIVTADGRLRVEAGEGLIRARGVAYATAERLRLPAPRTPWDGVADALADGPICPQDRARSERYTGRLVPAGAVQGEDCLNLTVTAPAAAGPPRPVMVWLPGGAYVTGAGSLPAYRPDRLVREQDVVVVGVNYRLGVFGYLSCPGVEPNLGVHDQLAALAWVRRNIAGFGGDPDNVTLFGNSAGAHAVLTLAALPQARGLFRRVIAQSAPLGLDHDRAALADDVGAAVRKRVPASELPRASVATLLAAQAAAVDDVGLIRGLLAFGPAPGRGGLPDEAEIRRARLDGASPLEVIIGTAANDGHIKPSVALWRVPGIGRAAARGLDGYYTRRGFGTPARELADALARAGRRVFLYRFGWEPPGSPFGACHTIELPFLLGTAEAWAPAPMLRGAGPGEVELIGTRMREAWAAFARGGDPGWPAHRAGDAPHELPERRWTDPGSRTLAPR